MAQKQKPSMDGYNAAMDWLFDNRPHMMEYIAALGAPKNDLRCDRAMVVAGADMKPRLYANDEFLQKIGPAQAAGVLVHEFRHVLLNHFSESANPKPNWKYPIVVRDAQEATINDSIEITGYELPDDVIRGENRGGVFYGYWNTAEAYGPMEDWYLSQAQNQDSSDDQEDDSDSDSDSEGDGSEEQSQSGSGSSSGSGSGSASDSNDDSSDDSPEASSEGSGQGTASGSAEDADSQPSESSSDEPSQESGAAEGSTDTEDGDSDSASSSGDQSTDGDSDSDSDSEGSAEGSDSQDAEDAEEADGAGNSGDELEDLLDDHTSSDGCNHGGYIEDENGELREMSDEELEDFEDSLSGILSEVIGSNPMPEDEKPSEEELDGMDQDVAEAVDPSRGGVYSKAGNGSSAAEEVLAGGKLHLGWLKLLQKINPDVGKDDGGMNAKASYNWARPRRTTSLIPGVHLPTPGAPRGMGVGAKQKPVALIALDFSASIDRRLANAMRDMAQSIPEEHIEARCFTFSTETVPFDFRAKSNRVAGGGTDFSCIEHEARKIKKETGEYPFVICLTDGDAWFDGYSYQGMAEPTADQLSSRWLWVDVNTEDDEKAFKSAIPDYRVVAQPNKSALPYDRSKL